MRGTDTVATRYILVTNRLIAKLGRDSLGLSMRVEFFGPPGSGKSTSARHLMAQAQKSELLIPGKLSARVDFAFTNLPTGPDREMRFYSQRGTAEQHIKDYNTPAAGRA